MDVWVALVLGTENKEVFLCGAASCPVLVFVSYVFLYELVQNSNTMPPVNNSRQFDLGFG